MEAALIGLSVGLLIGLVAGWLWRTENDAKAWGQEMEAMRRLIPEDRAPYDWEIEEVRIRRPRR